jgi:8-oxo-dGTP diphosphatase
MIQKITLSRQEACPACGRYENRAPTVDAVIIRDAKVLLIKRGNDPFQGYWALPGGYVEWDETVEASCRREVKEETGLDVVTLDLSGVYSHPERHPRQTISIAFRALVEGEPQAGDDALEAAWFDIDDVPATIAFDHAQMIQDAIRLKRPDCREYVS